jgi:hypothetical protein
MPFSVSFKSGGCRIWILPEPFEYHPAGDRIAYIQGIGACKGNSDRGF